MEELGAAECGTGRRGQGRTLGVPPRRIDVRGAAFCRDGAVRLQGLAAAPDRHDARRRVAARRAGHHPQPACHARHASGAQRRRRRAEERHRRMAGVGRLGRLLRRRAWRHDQRPAGAAPAGLGAETLYLCAGVRRRLEPRHGAGRCALAFSDGGARALSTARATTTADIEDRCSPVARLLDPRTCRRSLSRRRSVCRSCVRFLRSAGLSSFDKTASHYGLGITLGNAEVQLAELAAAYAAFARGGMLLRPSCRS